MLPASGQKPNFPFGADHRKTCPTFMLKAIRAVAFMHRSSFSDIMER